jgi:hypothetical protein
MRRDAADARRYGCNGLMGIHWRTRVLAPNLGALAQAAWTQDPWNKSPFDPLPLPARAEGPAYPSTLDFYADWATHEFGRNAGPLAAAILEKVDCKLPRPADWVDGPGGIRPDARPWSEVARDYEFVDQFATVGRLVKGAGNEARFEYWRETFAYMRAMARLNCVWGAYNKVIEKVKALKDAEARKNLALEQALPLRRELVSRLAAVYDHMLATVSTMGELGPRC